MNQKGWLPRFLLCMIVLSTMGERKRGSVSGMDLPGIFYGRGCGVE